MKKITDPGHPMYKIDFVMNYVQSENIVKLLQVKTLRGSMQLTLLFYPQILEILTEPRDAIFNLTARTGISSPAISIIVSSSLVASMLIS